MCSRSMELNLPLCRISTQDLLTNVVQYDCCRARGIFFIQYFHKHKQKALQNLGVPVLFSRLEHMKRR